MNSFNKHNKMEKLYLIRDEVVTGDDIAFKIICEAGLSRLVTKVKQDKIDFAIITAYRYKNTKKENVQKNRDLRAEFNKRKMGVYPLVGHWQECQETDGKGNPLPYDSCPKDKLVDSVERSYLVPRGNMEQKEFQNFIQELAKKYKQDAYVISIDGKVQVVGSQTGDVYDTFSNMSLNKISQAYSQHVKKQNVPFVFEGIEIPNCVNYAKQVLYENEGFRWNIF